MEKLLKDLNEVQRHAVQLTDGPMLIVAGAGSGKTRVITYKVAHLIATGVASPSEITAVTFTNKATAEMKQRIESLLCDTCSYDELRFLTVSTFHSFCARVLRGHIDRLGISRDFVIYDSEDQKALISKLMDDHNIDKKDITPKAVVALFSSAKNAQTVIRPGSRLEKVYEDYEAELKIIRLGVDQHVMLLADERAGGRIDLLGVLARGAAGESRAVRDRRIGRLGRLGLKRGLGGRLARRGGFRGGVFRLGRLVGRLGHHFVLMPETGAVRDCIS